MIPFFTFKRIKLLMIAKICLPLAALTTSCRQIIPASEKMGCDFLQFHLFNLKIVEKKKRTYIFRFNSNGIETAKFHTTADKFSFLFSVFIFNKARAIKLAETLARKLRKLFRNKFDEQRRSGWKRMDLYRAFYFCGWRCIVFQIGTQSRLVWKNFNNLIHWRGTLILIFMLVDCFPFSLSLSLVRNVILYKADTRVYFFN